MEKIRLEEPLSRYILEKSHYRSDHTVKHNAFMPPQNSSEISVYRTCDLSPQEIWDIGVTHVAIKRGKSLLGRAEIKVSDAYKQKLNVVPDITPHIRHANICGFPVENREIARMIAVELSSCAKFYPHESV